MSNNQPRDIAGPAYRPAVTEDWPDLKVDPLTTGPAGRHPRREIRPVHLGARPPVEAAARSGAATAGTAQPLSAPSAQRSNQRSAEAARRDRGRLAAASQDAARQRLASLRKGRARRPESLAGRMVGVLRRADGWLTTRALLDILNDPARTPPTASTRVIRGADVAAYLAGYRKEGTVLARPVAEGTRLLEWRWAAFEAAAAAADAEAAR